MISSSCLKASVMVISPHGAPPVFAAILRDVNFFLIIYNFFVLLSVINVFYSKNEKKMKKAIFLATMMFASATVFGMNPSSRGFNREEKVQKEEFNQLMKAVKSNKPEKVKEIIGKHEEFNQLMEATKGNRNPYLTKLVNFSENGLFPLLIAVQNENKEIVEYLVDHGAKVNQDNLYGQTPLSEAAQNGNKEIAKYLIDHGANVKTLLFLAAQKEDEEIVKCLIDCGVSIDIVDRYGQTLLSWATKNGSEGIVKCLVDNGADVNKENDYGPTTLFRATRTKIVDKRVRTPLFGAVKNGNKEIVKYLVEKGADVNKENIYGETPLLFAVSAGAAQWIGGNPLLSAVQKRNKEIVEYLVDHGADVNKADSSGTTPLHLAAKSRNKSLIEYLIEKGADINSKNEIKKTPLSCAIEYYTKDLSVLTYLLDKGADPNIGNSLEQAVRNACLFGDTRTLEYLINYGADKEKMLSEAIREKSVTITKLLLDRGADPTKELTRLRRSLSLMEKLLEDYEPEESKEKRKIELMQEVNEEKQKEKEKFLLQAVTIGDSEFVKVLTKDGITEEKRNVYLSIARKKLPKSSDKKVNSLYEEIIDILSKTQTKESDERKS